MDTKIRNIRNINWLLDVRGERVGPMSTQQIVHKLMRREVKVVHRVSETGDGWVAICNEPLFEQYIIHLIEQVSQAVATGSVPNAELYSDKEVEEDKTIASTDIGELSGVYNMNAISLGISEQLSHAKELQQASTNLSTLRQLLSEIRIKRKVIIVAQNREENEYDEIHPDDKDEYVLNPQNIRDYVGSGTSKFLVTVGIIFVFIFFGLKWKEKVEEEELEAEKIVAKEELVRGQYSGAIAKENGIMQMSEDMLIELANKELGARQGSVVWSLIESAKNNGVLVPTSTIKPENHQKQTEIHEALCKRAYDYLLSGNLEKAEVFLLKSLALYSSDKSQAILLLLETALLYHQSKASRTSEIRIREIVNIISRYKKTNQKVNSKLFIAEMAAYQALGDMNMVENRVDAFLKDHPRGEKESLTLGFRQKTSWIGLLPHCIKIYNSNRNSSKFSAMLAGCLVRTASAPKAEPYIYYAYKKTPNDQVIKDLLGWVYFEIGKNEKAKKIMWDPNTPSYKVSNFLTMSRLEFCKVNGSDEFCRGRNTASDK